MSTILTARYHPGRSGGVGSCRMGFKSCVIPMNGSGRLVLSDSDAFRCSPFISASWIWPDLIRSIESEA